MQLSSRLLLLLSSPRRRALQATCNLTLDTVCPWTFDGVCDADGLVCPLRNADCLDCDPCTAHNQDCTTCVESGCAWCNDHCMTPEYTAHDEVAQLGLCNATTWTTTPDQCGTGSRTVSDSSTSVSSTNRENRYPEGLAEAIANYTCYADNADAECKYRFNKVCEVDNGICAADCFDCDPCRAYRFDGCQACVQANCVWCGVDALCVSPTALGGALDDDDARSSLTCSTADFISTCPANDATDPLEEAMGWIYDAINVRPAWEKGYSGKGVNIRVNDDGIDTSHPEIGEDRFSAMDSCPLNTPIGTHGTTIASIAAGTANNGVCGKGIAYEATLSACRVLETEYGDFAVANEKRDYKFLSKYIDGVDIMINSFGESGCYRDVDRRRDLLRLLQSTDCPFSDGDKSPCLSCVGEDWSGDKSGNCTEAVVKYCGSDLVLFRDQDIDICHDYLQLFTACAYTTLSTFELENILVGITEGRNRKGIIYFWASGNDHDSGANVNTEGILISRFIIPVAATGKDGKRTSFSTGGAGLFITGPGGDFDHYTNSLGAKLGGGCHDIGAGTSYSAPLVAGVTALMLEARPDLTWRDVQGIFATTSQKVHADDPSWTTNGAGLHHSDHYGFGVVDAGAAVTAAETWDLYSIEWATTLNSGIVNELIPDDESQAVSSIITLESEVPETFVIESVEVVVEISHASRGDLDIVLTSPQGTKSLLHPGKRPETSWNQNWKFLTVRNWGEGAIGDWTLELVDKSPGDVADCADRPWRLETASGETFRCHDLNFDYYVCEDGGIGPDFGETLGTIAGSLLDPTLADKGGLTPGEACCACGGGIPPEQVRDQLGSWTITIYGHNLGPPPSTEGAEASSGIQAHLFRLAWFSTIAFGPLLSWF